MFNEPVFIPSNFSLVIYWKSNKFSTLWFISNALSFSNSVVKSNSLKYIKKGFMLNMVLLLLQNEYYVFFKMLYYTIFIKKENINYIFTEVFIEEYFMYDEWTRIYSICSFTCDLLKRQWVLNLMIRFQSSEIQQCCCYE